MKIIHTKVDEKTNRVNFLLIKLRLLMILYDFKLPENNDKICNLCIFSLDDVLSYTICARCERILLFDDHPHA